MQNLTQLNKIIISNTEKDKKHVSNHLGTIALCGVTKRSSHYGELIPKNSDSEEYCPTCVLKAKSIYPGHFN